MRSPTLGRKVFSAGNNTAYWQGKKYLGIGPSAHSYNGLQRSWNVANNHKYIKAIAENKLPLTTETLSQKDRYNEYVMTGLRAHWGVSLTYIEKEFGLNYKTYLLEQAGKYINDKLLFITADEADPALKTTRKGKFLSDGIASDLFLLNLQ